MKKKEFQEKLLSVLLKQENESNNLASDFIGKYVIIRTRDAGVHVGYLKSYVNRECVLTNSRRLWCWEGSFTLNGVAVKGVKSAKMPLPVDKIFISDVSEIIPCTKKVEKQLTEMEVHYDNE